MKSSYILSIIRSGMGVMTSRAVGLFRDVAIAGVYGASALTDLFFVAFAIPNLFRQFFAEGAISSAYVPFLNDKLVHQGMRAANKYLTQLILVQTGLIFAVSALLMLAAPYVIMLFMPGYAADKESVVVGATILRIVMPYLFFVGIAGLLAGYLNLAGSYFVGYASTSLLNLMMIVGAVIGYYKGGNIYYLALSVLAGGLLQFLMVYIYSRRKGFRVTAEGPLDTDVKKTYKLLVPSLAGVGISQLNFLVGRVLASFLAPGSISWLFYANRLFQFPLGVFSVTISTVSLTELSKVRTAGNNEGVTVLIDRAITALLLIIIPATIGLVGLSEELIRLIYARSAFTFFDVQMSALALKMYSAGLLFYSLASVFTKVYHSDKNTKTPVKYAAICFCINLIANLLLMKPLGHTGIALASSIAALFNTVLLYRGLSGYRFRIRENSKILLKVITASCLMAGVMLFLKYQQTPVLVTVTASAVSYFALLIFMGVRLKDLLKKSIE